MNFDTNSINKTNQLYTACQPAINKEQRVELTFSNENLSNNNIENNQQRRQPQKILNQITNKQSNEINDGNFITLFQQEDEKTKNENEKQNNFSFNTNFLQKVIMFDFLKLLLQCSKSINLDKILQLRHIPYLSKESSLEQNYHKFNQLLNNLIENSTKHKQKVSHIRMLNVIFQTFKVPIISQCITISILNGLKIFYSSCIIFLLEAVSVNDTALMYTWASILCLVQFINMCVGHNILRFYINFFPIFKTCFMRILYQKISSLSSFSIKQANVGKLVNLVSNDLNLLEAKSYNMINLLTFPFTFIAIAIVLYQRLDGYSLIGFGFLIAYIPCQIIQAKASQGYFRQKAQLVDQRIKFTNEVIEGIRLIKMYAWEEAFQKFIVTIRNAEIGKILMIQVIFFSQLAFTSVTHLFACFISFTSTYTYGDSSILTVPKMLSVLDLFSFTKQQLVLQSILGITGFFELKVILERMITVLTIESSKMQHLSADLLLKAAMDGQNINDLSLTQGSIQMQNFYAYWKTSTPVIENFTLNVNPGEFIGIVGRVGSGKSSLLNCILQEIPYYNGHFCFNGSLAYVEQEPYIFSSTIQENILFGSEYDEDFYMKVLDACCLNDDIKSLDNGDKTQIGERGINLSGGQKARISLARAIYSKSQIILLDDPLSAVDTKVAKLLVENAILGLLKGKTILLVTHQIHFTQKADKIIVMKDGKLLQEGTYIELQSTLKEMSNNQDLDNSNQDEKKSQNVEGDEQFINNEQNIDEDITEREEQTSKDQSKEKEIAKKNDQIFTKESDENMEVNFSTYKKYFGYSSLRWLIPFMFAFFIMCEVIFIFYTRTISDYNENEDKLNESINWLGYLTLILLVASLLRYISLTLIVYSSNYNIHNKMVYSLVRAKVLFFDTTPSGRILNKFSSDLGLIDQELSKTMQDSIEILSNFSILLVMIFIINPYFIIVVVVELAFIRWFVLLANKPLVQSKQIDLRHRSPIYTCFNQTIQGVLPIKVYMKQNIFLKNFNILLENSLRTSITTMISARAYAFYMHIGASCFSFIGIFMILSINNDPALLGQAIIFFISISENIQWGLRQLIQTDVFMSSALRAMNLIEIEHEPQLRSQYDQQFFIKNDANYKIQSKPSNGQTYSFPTNGQVEFKNVQMKYRKELSNVLNGLSFKIQAGEKVGFIGRTGAGKSSIIQALYRMTEIEKEIVEKEDSFIKIDGHISQNLGIHTIRSGISIIPQLPFIFSGSIRRNIDPLNQYTDQDILSILEDIHLKEKVLRLDKGLLTDMTNVSEVFSTGEKQLICLGRAILRKSKLIVLDEATANCDLMTDQIIQQKIRQKFINSSIITIAHRLNTIADYDRVIVMDKGKVIEEGVPYQLLLQDKSIFKEMVKQTGQKNFNQIFSIAKSSFKSK